MTTATQPQRVLGIDAAFLYNETRSTPWHIVGVLVLDPSTAADGFDADVMRRVIAERVGRIEAFRRRIVDVRGALSVPHWVLDQTVDVTLHVQRVAVPGLTGFAALAELAARTAKVALPRDRPLWQIQVVDDIGDGRVGLVAKVHHSVMDGVAAVGVLGALFDLEPTPPVRKDVPRVPDSADIVLGVDAMLRALTGMPDVLVRTVRTVPGAAVGFVRALRAAGRSVTLPLTAPRTPLNRSISAERSVCLTALPLARVREVAARHDATVNDIAVAVCAGALRSWLDEAGVLPSRPLVAAVPVAVPPDHDHMAGNELSVLFTTVPTHLADTEARLVASRSAMRDAKATYRDVGPRTLATLAEAAPWNVIGVLFRAYSSLGLAGRLPLPVNLVLSNVPGPEIPVYCGGARLDALFALGPIFDGAALNVTIVTCGEDLDIGIVTCPDVAPAPVARLARHLDAALDELVALAPTGR